MSIFRKPGYEIDRPEPSEIFLKARNIAGSQLQGEFNKNKGRVPESRDYKWIKAELTYPSFDHLTFGCGNQVFSVLVDLCEGGRSTLTEREGDRFLKATRENNLVPCRFQVMAPTLRPASAGWNLTHFTTGTRIIPSEMVSDTNVSMSEWELRSFAIQVVRNHIEQEGKGKVLSFCDVLQIDPQVWFEDVGGNRCWVVVRHLMLPDDAAVAQWGGLAESNPQLRSFDGFFAGVSLFSSAPFLYDPDGNLIALSERFSGKAPLYRGDQFYVKFQGLQQLQVVTDGGSATRAQDDFPDTPDQTRKGAPVGKTPLPQPGRVVPVRLPEDTDPRKLEACRAFARMMNTLDPCHLLPWLTDDCQYTSQWVMEDINGKDAYAAYIQGKFNLIKRTGSRVWAEIAYTDAFEAGPCVVLAQDSRENLTATLLLKLTDGKISQMTMCAIPSPQECRRTGELPA